MGQWLSKPQKAELQYVFDQSSTWVGVTSLRIGEQDVPLEFMFHAPKISEERLADFKAGKTKLEVEFDASQLRFERATKDPEKRREEFDPRTIDSWALSGSPLMTTCGDRIAQSSHGRATIDGQQADYTLQVLHPQPAGTRTSQGIATGNTPRYARPAGRAPSSSGRGCRARRARVAARAAAIPPAGAAMPAAATPR